MTSPACFLHIFPLSFFAAGNTVKQYVPFLLIRLLLVAGLPVCTHGEAAAATWQWSRAAGREQVTIVPDGPSGRADTRRTGEQSLAITMTPPPQTLEQQGAASAPEALVSGVTLENGVIGVSTRTPAFGFIAARPTANGVVVILYPDPLGLRWRPDGGLAPVPPAVVAAPPPGASRMTSPVESSPGTPLLATETPSLPEAAPSSPALLSAGQADIGQQTPSSVPTLSSQTDALSSTVLPAPAAVTDVSRGEPEPGLSVPVSPSMPTPVTGPVPRSDTSPPPVPSSAPAEPAEPPVPDSQSRAVEPLVELPDPEPETPASVDPIPRPENTPPASEAPTVDSGASPALPPALPEDAARALAPSPASVTSEAVPVIPSVRGRLNMRGPEAWPEDRALTSETISPAQVVATAHTGTVSPDASEAGVASSPLPPSPALSALEETPDGRPATAMEPDNAGENDVSIPAELPSQSGKLNTHTPDHLLDDSAAAPEAPAPEAPVEDLLEPAPIYVDEAGNPVPPPPDVPALLAAMRTAIKEGHYPDALTAIDVLRNVELAREEREEMLYDAMTALYENNRPNFTKHAQDIIDAANEAMNFNLDSVRVPDALAVLAEVNLALNNVEDARGYVHLMRRKYPDNPQVPASLLALGARQMDRQEYAEAALSLQTIIQEYPDSKATKDAARLETYALYRQGHTDRALTLVDFVDRRWPRLYLEDPDYLAVSADIRFKQGHLEEALGTYWTQYNLEPVNPESALTLQHIAETYYLLGNRGAAAKVLDELVRAFPLGAEAPKALLRLGENGIHEGNPTVDELLALFDAPNPRVPGLYYQRILKDYPQSPEAMTAQLRTMAWQLWNKDYLPAMTAARSFLIDYADRPESLRARTVLLRGFAHELANSLEEQNYERVLRLWDDFPQVHEEYLPLEPDVRMALARAHLNRGEQKEGLELLAPFLDGPGDTDYALYTYNLYLATWLREQNWDAILSLGEKVAAWKLPAEARDQLDYAQALSAENLGLQGRALPLWHKLAGRQDIPLYQRAYATYFLARDAEKRQDLRDAYQYNLDTLGMFTQLQDEQSPYADSERVRESIAALMDVTEIAGRYAEALEWANKYALFVPDNSPDYAGLQFREAGLHRKMGDMARWRALLQGIVDKEPDSVFGKMAASELRTQDVARDLTRFTGN